MTPGPTPQPSPLPPGSTNTPSRPPTDSDTPERPAQILPDGYVFAGFIPITDTSRTLSSLTREARPQIHHLARAAGATLTRQPAIRITTGDQVDGAHAYEAVLTFTAPAIPRRHA